MDSSTLLHEFDAPAPFVTSDGTQGACIFTPDSVRQSLSKWFDEGETICGLCNFAADQHAPVPA